MRKLLYGFILLAPLVGVNAMAQEPLILSVGVQQFAIDKGLHKALGLSGEASDIAEYINTLAAIEVAAQARAYALGQEQPSPEDYAVAASLWCHIPLPFKPPEVREYADTVEGAYVAEDKRSAIENALGPQVLKASFDELQSATPVDLDHFKNEFLNFDALQ